MLVNKNMYDTYVLYMVRLKSLGWYICMYVHPYIQRRRFFFHFYFSIVISANPPTYVFKAVLGVYRHNK